MPSLRDWSFGPSTETRCVLSVCMGLVFSDGYVGEIEDCFAKRKLQYDFALIVRHFEDSTQQSPLNAFGLQKFPDHRARDFPGAVRIAQLLAFGIGDQFIADAGVEEIPRHESKSTLVGVRFGNRRLLTSSLSGIREKSPVPKKRSEEHTS